MRYLHVLILLIILLGCQQNNTKIEVTDQAIVKKESKAYEEIVVFFHFNEPKPSFEELFLMTGVESSDIPQKNRQFEKLSPLKISFLDDQYFGIKNENTMGDAVAIWMIPLKNGKAQYHDADAPFDSILMEYTVLNNNVADAVLVKKVFDAFTNLGAKVVFEDKEIQEYTPIKNKMTETIQLCRTELNVEPGSDEALQLLWGDHPFFGNQ